MYRDLKQMDWNEIGAAKGGAVARAVEHQVSRAMGDIKRAPDIAKDRVVTIKLKFSPNTSEDDELQSISMETEVSGSMPARSQRITVLCDSDAGVDVAVYNPDSPGNPFQKTMFDEKEESDAGE